MKESSFSKTVKESSFGKAMKEKEIFERLRAQGNKVTLRLRFMLTVSSIMLGGGVAALLLAWLLQVIFPVLTTLSIWWRLAILGGMMSLFVSLFLARRLFRPIDELRDAMRKVADGSFNVRLETKSTAKEFQEVLAGFNMMVQELQSTEIVQSDFVSNVSHEFKTPINAIEGYATLLQNKDNSEEAENTYVEKILFNTNRLSSLVSNVLLLSKIENQTLGLHKTTYSIGEQIRSDLLALEPAWALKSIEFDVEIEDTDYTGYEALMHHVWSNLIGNAVKFAPDGSEIKIKLQKNDDRLIFTIEDQGPGISEEAKRHIFDKFYQEDASHKSEGNGLGLALVKRILGVCDGAISVENITPTGCRFRVELPVTKE